MIIFSLVNRHSNEVIVRGSFEFCATHLRAAKNSTLLAIRKAGPNVGNAYTKASVTFCPDDNCYYPSDEQASAIGMDTYPSDDDGISAFLGSAKRSRRTRKSVNA